MEVLLSLCFFTQGKTALCNNFPDRMKMYKMQRASYGGTVYGAFRHSKSAVSIIGLFKRTANVVQFLFWKTGNSQHQRNQKYVKQNFSTSTRQLIGVIV